MQRKGLYCDKNSPNTEINLQAEAQSFEGKKRCICVFQI